MNLDWNDIFDSLLTTFFRFGVVAGAYVIARIMTEVYRKNSEQPWLWQVMASIVPCLAAATIISWFFWADIHFESDEYESTPSIPTKQTHQLGAKVFITLVIPALLGVWRGFKTPKTTLTTKYSENPYPDNEYN